MAELTEGASNPRQYGIPEGARDILDLIEHRNMGFSLGNIFKACYRFGIKDNDPLYEIDKMIFFAERLREKYEQANKN